MSDLYFDPSDFGKGDTTTNKCALRLDPFSHDFLIRMVFNFGINRKPKNRTDCPVNDLGNI